MLQKKALRLIVNDDYIAHSEPICKHLQLLKVTDMYRIAIWKFYFKLMNNTLPSYFEIMKPLLPLICDHHIIRKPVFHLPYIRHDYAKQLLKYQLVKLLNDENKSILITAKVHTHSFQGFKRYIKQSIVDSYIDRCNTMHCYTCERRERRVSE